MRGLIAFVLVAPILLGLAGCERANEPKPSWIGRLIRHGENGWLVDFFDDQQLLEAVQKALADPAGTQAMRWAAVASVKERFAQAAGTAGYLDLMGCDLSVTLGLNLRSEFLREAQ